MSRIAHAPGTVREISRMPEMNETANETRECRSRNIKHLARTGVLLLNPWEFGG